MADCLGVYTSLFDYLGLLVAVIWSTRARPTVALVTKLFQVPTRAARAKTSTSVTVIVRI